MQSPSMRAPDRSGAAAGVVSQRSAEALAKQNRHKSRWAVLAMTCFGLFGQFYAYDNPSTLYSAMRERFKDDANFDLHFNMLYSFYSIPNIILPLVCGILIDRIGIKLSVLVLASLVATGGGLVVLGAHQTSWPLMLLGRALFGVGGESLQVAQNALLYFEGAEIALALGLNLSIARMGSSVNAVSTPWIATLCDNNPVVPFAVGWLLCLASSFANVGSVWREYFGRQGGLDDEEVSLNMITKLTRPYWFLTALCVLMYGAILPFNNIAQPLFIATAYSSEATTIASLHASRASAWMFAISAIATPIFGHMVDRFGRRPALLAVSATLLTATHGTMMLLNPYMASVQLGAVYTVFAAALWPSIALVVNKNSLGTAYGVCVCLQNIGLASIPILVGDLQQHADNATGVDGKLTAYGEIEKFFTLLSFISTALAWTLYFESGPLAALNLPSGAQNKAISKDAPKLAGSSASPGKDGENSFDEEEREETLPLKAGNLVPAEVPGLTGGASTTASEYGSGGYSS
eukprot:g1367.t1